MSGDIPSTPQQDVPRLPKKTDATDGSFQMLNLCSSLTQSGVAAHSIHTAPQDVSRSQHLHCPAHLPWGTLVSSLSSVAAPAVSAWQALCTEGGCERAAFSSEREDFP
ncbi:unnamed protein product [Pleuronectes platessa]|uniref:Uncharacterized protein n=1 Tax=Pleuronectes platessa TaxID=8262 RepID=A0A9N7V513_PLEPL|nr:unnamed protein product [Pleuronectes platessa]